MSTFVRQYQRNTEYNPPQKEKYRPPELEENGLQFQWSVLLRYGIKGRKRKETRRVSAANGRTGKSMAGAAGLFGPVSRYNETERAGNNPGLSAFKTNLILQLTKTDI